MSARKSWSLNSLQIRARIRSQSYIAQYKIQRSKVECDQTFVFVSSKMREVERELTGWDEEPSELIYFKIYKSQTPIIEQAIETAALMFGTDKSRGYCLEMICADFLAGAHLDNGDPEILLNSISRYYKFLRGEQQQALLQTLTE